MMRDFTLDYSEEKESNFESRVATDYYQYLAIQQLLVYGCMTPMMTLLTDMHPLKVEKKDDDNDKIYDIKR